MQTEDFDDAFRLEIDRVEHEDVSDNEVEKIFNYVNRKRSDSNKKSYFLYGSLTLMFVTIAGLLAWNITQMKEKESLEDTVALLQHNSTSNLKNNNVIIQRDTIYIKEYVRSTTNFREVKEARKVIRSQNKLIAVLENESTTNSILNKTSVSANVLKSDNIVVNKTKNSKRKTSKIVASGSSLYTTNIEGKNNTVIEYIKKKNDLLLLEENPFVVDDLTFQMLPSGDPIKDQPVEPKLGSKKFMYQLGIGTNIADDQKSFSVLMGIDLNTHWNVSTGINLLKIDNYNENDKDEFHYYSNLATVTDTSLFTFVGVKQTIYQIPVTISYLIPLKKKFSLLFGLGTDLDIYATQHVRYKLRQEEKSIDKKSPVLVFNNAVLSVGINKEWQHFSIQLSPFINPQLTRVSYKNPESYYGSRIRLFYTF